MLAPAIILTATGTLILLAAAAQALLARADDYAEPYGDLPHLPRGARVNLEPSHPASIAGEGQRDHV